MIHQRTTQAVCGWRCFPLGPRNRVGYVFRRCHQIDAHAHYQSLQQGVLHASFHQDSAQLASAQNQIVGPFNAPVRSIWFRSFRRPSRSRKSTILQGFHSRHRQLRLQRRQMLGRKPQRRTQNAQKHIAFPAILPAGSALTAPLGLPIGRNGSPAQRFIYFQIPPRFGLS